MSNKNGDNSFWTTGVRIIAGTATILTAIVGLIVALTGPSYTQYPINYPPVAFVDSINPCPALKGQSVIFTCHGIDSDSDDYITEYRWESNIDGVLSDQKTFSTSSLTSGSHQIILRVMDNHGQWSNEVTRNLEIETPTSTPTSTPTPTPINNPPVAFLDSISPSPALVGQSVTFTCHGNDPDNDDYITEYRWESSIDGFLSNQTIFSISSLASGSHQIILQVKDNHGQWSNKVTRNLTVEDIKIPSAEIKNISTSHNYYYYILHSKGMLINVDFDIHNLKGKDCRASAYFYFEDGTPLYDFNGKYNTAAGKVASSAEFEPLYEHSSFDGLGIYLPYDELHMAPGSYNLKFYITIDDGDTVLDESDWVHFSYIQGY